MPTLSNKVTVTLTLPDESEYIPTIWDEDIVIEISKKKDEVFYRKSITTRHTFLKQDFDVINAIEEDPVERCKKILYSLDHEAGNVISGYISLEDSSPDRFRSKIEAPVRADNDIDCIETIWENKVNLLATPFTVTTEPLFGELEEVSCIGTVGFNSTNIETILSEVILQLSDEDQCIGEEDGPVELWTPRRVSSTSITDGDSFGTIYSGTFTIWMVREKLVSNTVPDGDWTQDTIDPFLWYRKPTTTENLDLRDIDINLSGGGKYHREWDVDIEVVGSEFDNGVKLETTFDMLLDGCPLMVVSDFFSINQDGTSPDNAAYNEAADKLQQLILFQKSDIIDSDASNNASKSETTLKKWLTLWRETFQAYHNVEGDNLRIEHISRFSTNEIGLDLTVEPYATQLLGMNQYSYDKSDNPERETFKWMDDVDLRFESRDIIYSQVCSTPNVKQSIKLEATTALEYVRANPDLISKEGWFIMSTQFIAGGFKINQQAILGSGFYLNGALSWQEIHKYYWLHDRLQPEGKLNGDQTVFESSILKRIPTKIVINMSIAEFIAWDYTKKIETPFWTCELKKAQYSLNTEKLSLELLF